MKRNEAIEILERYNQLLQEEGYADADLWCEPPTAIDQFLATEWAKENIPTFDEKYGEGIELFKEAYARGMRVVDGHNLLIGE
jgi:hypothetical protein